MKLHSPQFEKALRRRVKQAVRASPDLSGKFKQYRWWANRRLGAAFLLPFLSFGLAAFMYDVAQKTGHVATALACLSVWLALGVVLHVLNLRSKLYTSPDLPAFPLLPVLGETVFRWQFQKYFRRSLFSLLDIIVGFAVLGFYLEFGAMQYLAAFLLALLCWALIVALTILYAKHLMAIHRYIVLAVFFGFVLFVVEHNSAAVLRTFDHSAPVLNLLLPTGWTVSLFQLLLPHPQWVLLALIFPIVGMFLSAQDALALLRQSYLFHEVVAAEASDLLPGQASDPRTSRTPNPLLLPRSAAPHRVGLTTIEETITSREFLAPMAAPSGGWLESALWRWFTPRERILSEFVYPQGIALTRPWKTIGRNILLTIVAVVLSGFIPYIYRDVIQGTLLAAGLFITVSHIVFLALTTGRAFKSVSCSGVNIPMYAAYAVGFPELANLLLKSTVVQLPFIMVYAMSIGAFAGRVEAASITMGILVGLRVVFLLGAVRFLAIAFAFSSGTNDGSRASLRTLLLFVVMAGGTFFFLGLASLALFASNQEIAWLLCVLAVLLAYVVLRIYQWCYHCFRFDLMSLSRR